MGDCRWRELGAAVGLSANAAADRVRRLRQAGVILGFTALIDPAAGGRNLEALVGITLSHGVDSDQFAIEASQLPSVIEVLHLTGAPDYQLRVACRDTAELDMLLRTLRLRHGAADTETTIVLRSGPRAGRPSRRRIGRMDRRVIELWRCELPIQLAPMGSVSRDAAAGARGGRGRRRTRCTRRWRSRPRRSRRCSRRSPSGRGVRRQLHRPDDGPRLARARGRPGALCRLLPRRSRPGPGRARARGGAVCGWQVESAEEARAAEAAGCDLVIAKAWESGGRKRIEGPTLLPCSTRCSTPSPLPVIAAGGIATARGVAAVLAAGADGARVGTRFIAAAESDAHPAGSSGDRRRAPRTPSSATLSTRAAAPGPHRVLRGSIDAAEALPTSQAGALRLAGAEIPVPRFRPQPPTRESTGAIAAMALYAGQSAGAVHAVQPAAEIVAELATGVPERPLRSATATVESHHQLPRGRRTVMRASHLSAALLIAGGLSGLAAPAAGGAPPAGRGELRFVFTSTLGAAGVAGQVISGGAHDLLPFGRNAEPQGPFAAARCPFVPENFLP